MSFELTSSAFKQNGDIPRLFTGDGRDQSPPLAWRGAPEATRSFAIVCGDPDAPSGTWYHWAIFDIPATTAQLAQGHNPQGESPRQAINDFGRRGYGGPSPPRGHGKHHYIFAIYALGVERLDLPPKPRCVDVERAARGQALASAQLTGTYAR